MSGSAFQEKASKRLSDSDSNSATTPPPSAPREPKGLQHLTAFKSHQIGRCSSFSCTPRQAPSLPGWASCRSPAAAVFSVRSCTSRVRVPAWDCVLLPKVVDGVLEVSQSQSFLMVAARQVFTKCQGLVAYFCFRDSTWLRSKLTILQQFS